METKSRRERLETDCGVSVWKLLGTQGPTVRRIKAAKHSDWIFNLLHEAAHVFYKEYTHLQIQQHCNKHCDK